MKATFVASFAVAVAMLISSASIAQQNQQFQQNQTDSQPTANAGVFQQQPVSQQPAVVKKVGFRMANWRTFHGDGAPASTDMVATLQRIGCEVNQDDHGGHIDISFRCPNWKTVNVQDDAESDQWHQWLVNNEFDTVVLNPPTTNTLPTVMVRMQEWQTVHAQSAEQAQAMKDTYELIGCETAVDNHGDHIDLNFRCPEWSTIALDNSDAAHVWQDWLSKSGFETQHDHSADGQDAHAGHDHATTDSHAGHDHSTDDHAGHDHEGHDHE